MMDFHLNGGTYTLLDFEDGNNAEPRSSQGGSVTDGTLSTPSNNLFPASVWTHIYTSSAYYTYQNYQTSTGYITGASNTASLPFEIMVGNNEASYVPDGMTVYWLRVRAYPPNRVNAFKFSTTKDNNSSRLKVKCLRIIVFV